MVSNPSFEFNMYSSIDGMGWYIIPVRKVGNRYFLRSDNSRIPTDNFPKNVIYKNSHHSLGLSISCPYEYYTIDTETNELLPIDSSDIQSYQNI